MLVFSPFTAGHGGALAHTRKEATAERYLTTTLYNEPNHAPAALN
jgi:hypothetical protein